MNKTANYQLNQWEPGDPVLRTDFNADNAKIDEVLHRVDQRGLQLIRDYQTEKSGNLVLIDLSGINWDDWKIIIIEVYPTPGSSANMHFSPYGYQEGDPPIAYTRNIMVLFPLGSSTTPLFAVICTTEAKLYYKHYLPINSHSIAIDSNSKTDQLLAGSRVVIRGERM